MEKIMLLFDKEFDYVNTIKNLLEKNNYIVIVALSIEDCLEKLKKDKPNLLLMSSFLPRTKIMEAMSKMSGVKMAYLVTKDTYLGNETELYTNLIGFIEDNEKSDQFILNIKKFMQK